jgi:FkbM family methyltransferase
MNAIKKMVPKQIRPLAQTIYWKLFSNEHKADFSPKQYGKLSALKCVVSYNKYGGYCVPESSRHRPAARAILSSDVWEPQTIDFIITNCGSGDVVHAGTFFGDFLPAISKGVSTSSKIWAFEPNPENYRCARITLEINDLNNIVLTNAGLGAKREVLLLQTTDENGRALGGASRVIGKESNKATQGTIVQIVTIDDTVGNDRNVSIIQLDVEGHEKEALLGALKTIKRCLPIIILEVLPNSTLLGSVWFAENITGLGYRKISNLHDNVVFICRPHE